MNTLLTFSQRQKQTRKRVLEISHKNHLSHLGSCLSAVDAIDAIHDVKKKDEKFVLSNGHAGVALYAILEKNKIIKKPSTTYSLFVHPDRNKKIGIYVSSGSLGQGLPIAVGMALSDRKKNVYCMISDGETTEGSIWEALRIAVDQKLENLKIVLNANGWGAYDPISLPVLYRRLKAFGCEIRNVDGHNIPKIKQMLATKTDRKPLLLFTNTIAEQFPFLVGQDAHYYVMNDSDFKSAMEILKT